MYYRIHADNVFNSIGVWLFSVIHHPNAIVVKNDSPLWQQIVAYKIEMAKAVLYYEGETAATNYVKLTNKIRLLVIECEQKVLNLSDEEYNRRRENAIANEQLRLELAESGKTVEDIQRLEREIELQYVAKDKADEDFNISASDVVFINNEIKKDESIPNDKEGYDLGSYFKQLEEQDNKEYEVILNSTLQKKTILRYGILSWLFFELSVIFNLVLIKTKYKYLHQRK